MTPCGRGCCFTGLQVCAKQRDCACHWGDLKPAPSIGETAARHRDPTANQAIANIMRAQKQKRRARPNNPKEDQ